MSKLFENQPRTDRSEGPSEESEDPPALAEAEARTEVETEVETEPGITASQAIRTRSQAPVRLLILHLNQDDPRKCSARKLARFHLAELVKTPYRIPFGAVWLDPFCQEELGPAHRRVMERRGLVAVDCSWAHARQVFARSDRRRALRLSLPPLVAANPVNFGKAHKLTTVEALAAALALTGHGEQGAGLLAKFKWGPHFYSLNGLGRD